MSENSASTEGQQEIVIEKLQLDLVSGQTKSLRITPGHSSEAGQLTEPLNSRDLADYRAAQGKIAGFEQPPNEEAKRRIRELVGPLQEKLLEIVPAKARQRLSMNDQKRPGRLAALELVLEDPELERYPWELVAEPLALIAGVDNVTVYRRVFPDSDQPVPRAWTDRILLSGSEAMQRVPPFVEKELAWISEELKAQNLKPECCTGIQPNLDELLAKIRPGAFHLVAHGTSSGVSFQAEPGPTLDDLKVDPAFIGRALGRSTVWVAMFNCCNSATPPPGGEPPARRIAELSRVATIGMGGKIQPYIGATFARSFYRCLGSGRSVLQAYHAGIQAIRGNDTYSGMWSMPIMYATDADIIPFPVDDEARVRLGLEQVRVHLSALDSELAELANGPDRSPGEWSTQTSTPMVRIECIQTYLAAVTDAYARTRRSERYLRQMTHIRSELDSILPCTRGSLGRLTDVSGQPDQRREAQGKFSVHRLQQQRMITKVERLLRDA